MYVIGLTGGVGSGKSVAAKMLEELYKAELLTADNLGHKVMEAGTDGYKEVISYFGESIVSDDGSIDRVKLAEIVFGDMAALEKLNGIIHPRVKSYISQYISDRKDKDGIILLETAILYETGCDGLCNEVWYVFASRKVRIERLMEGRGYSLKKAESIMDRQKPEEFFLERANRVIENGGSKGELRRVLCRAMKEKVIPAYSGVQFGNEESAVRCDEQGNIQNVMERF